MTWVASARLLTRPQRSSYGEHLNFSQRQLHVDLFPYQKFSLLEERTFLTMSSFRRKSMPLPVAADHREALLASHSKLHTLHTSLATAEITTLLSSM